jgi:hypothetical protein
MWGRVETASGLAGGPASPDRGRAAREAYYSGDAARALALAPAAGEAWVAGLAAWRLARYEESRAFFRGVAIDDDRDEWLRSAGAFWAARASTRCWARTTRPWPSSRWRPARRTPSTAWSRERSLALQGIKLGAVQRPDRRALAEAVSSFGLTRAATAPVLPDVASLVKANRPGAPRRGPDADRPRDRGRTRAARRPDPGEDF